MCSGARGRKKSNTWWRSKKKKFSDGRWESCLYGIFEENKGGWCFLYQNYVFKVRNRETNNDEGGGWRLFAGRASNGWIPPPPIQPNNYQARARSRTFQTPPINPRPFSVNVQTPVTSTCGPRIKTRTSPTRYLIQVRKLNAIFGFSGPSIRMCCLPFN